MAKKFDDIFTKNKSEESTNTQIEEWMWDNYKHLYEPTNFQQYNLITYLQNTQIEEEFKNILNYVCTLTEIRHHENQKRLEILIPNIYEKSKESEWDTNLQNYKTETRKKLQQLKELIKSHESLIQPQKTHLRLLQIAASEEPYISLYELIPISHYLTNRTLTPAQYNKLEKLFGKEILQ